MPVAYFRDLAQDQIVAYEGLSVIYGMAGNSAKCHEFAKRGLDELAQIALLRPMMSGVIPAEAFNELEQHPQNERNVSACR